MTPPFNRLIVGAALVLAATALAAGCGGSDEASGTTTETETTTTAPTSDLRIALVADVDLRREMAPDRPLERLARLEQSARESPGATERVAAAFPEQGLQRPLAYLEDDGEARVTWSGRLG